MKRYKVQTMFQGKRKFVLTDRGSKISNNHVIVEEDLTQFVKRVNSLTNISEIEEIETSTNENDGGLTQKEKYNFLTVSKLYQNN